ncbi:glycosyl transferase possibly involved in lipopolysaccharide synthesis [Beggiatoa alba B18LD]|uniref:Glycosyl transferase possibly involved in lipopolysaccharide synthesis n=1 Tax=Beggiatoa alba B18LD TaxID=395493 RepID=I3CHJ5_9GAMM|nr:sugar transferase [Beggiatoa alba]EIJ43088.1 glycosyl transferase possibly involved in lipopolysaccharide synthesis [Beggiatoa alba B18LD]
MRVKRGFDLCCVIPAIILLSPLLLSLAIWIKLDSQGSIFFLQTRVGQGGRLFKIFKFRTMHANTGLKITATTDKRITRAGMFLRRYKLDELPQLFNVLIGDMSLVGPRPEVPDYVAHYPEAVKAEVLSVPCGITDYASIAFRHEGELLATSDNPEKTYIQEILPIKLAYQQQYVRERSLWVDIKIILQTLKVL